MQRKRWRYEEGILIERACLAPSPLKSSERLAAIKNAALTYYVAQAPCVREPGRAYASRDWRRYPIWHGGGRGAAGEAAGRTAYGKRQGTAQEAPQGSSAR